MSQSLSVGIVHESSRVQLPIQRKLPVNDMSSSINVRLTKKWVNA